MKSKIKTVEDAFQKLGLDIKCLPEVSLLTPELGEYVINNYKLTIVVQAINQEANKNKPWIPDWNDSDEYKYYPWFYMSASGFSYDDFDRWCAHALCGSRLCFKSSELAKYAGNQFLELYQKVFLIQK